MPVLITQGAHVMTFSGDTPQTERENCTPVLETERLVLRAPRIEDAKIVATLANDRRIAENTLRIPYPYKPADATQWIAAANTRPGERTFLIWRRDDIVGACGFDLREGPEPEIGYWLGAKYWGNGYATEAVHALIDDAFSAERCAALRAGARVSNPASRRVLEKCGFQWDGVALYRFHAIKSSAPCDRFRLERRNWESRERLNAPYAIEKHVSS
jgi:RimJ/RimL family protein N-acetyltransferase